MAPARANLTRYCTTAGKRDIDGQEGGHQHRLQRTGLGALREWQECEKNVSSQFFDVRKINLSWIKVLLGRREHLTGLQGCNLNETIDLIIGRDCEAQAPGGDAQGSASCISSAGPLQSKALQRVPERREPHTKGGHAWGNARTTYSS
jgi:hypothetical protein